MLFVSRYCGSGGFAVVDTDDMTETQFDGYADAPYFEICTSGMNVKGIIR